MGFRMAVRRCSSSTVSGWSLAGHQDLHLLAEVALEGGSHHGLAVHGVAGQAALGAHDREARGLVGDGRVGARLRRAWPGSGASSPPKYQALNSSSGTTTTLVSIRLWSTPQMTVHSMS